MRRTGPNFPIDILYIGTLPPHPGGSAINAAQILEGFAAAGHRVRAIAPSTPGPDQLPVPLGVDVARYVMPSFESSPDQPSSGQYRETQRQEIQRLFPMLADPARPPVVIIGREIFVLDVAELARSRGLRSVLWAQGATTWGMVNGSLPRSLTQKILAETRRVDRVVAVARHMYKPLRELGVENVEVVANGVDIERFRPGPRNRKLLEALDIPADHLVVLHASNMKAMKRPQDIVFAADIVVKKNPLVTWIIAGDGPVLEQLHTLVNDRGLTEQFRFTGWIDHANMPDWLRTADLAVMPSTNEGLALAYLEAQASGRVLLASDIPAAREVIKDAENGLLFPVGDTERLARHVLRLAGDPGLRKRIGGCARESALGHSMNDTVAGHLRVLKDLAG